MPRDTRKKFAAITASLILVSLILIIMFMPSDAQQTQPSQPAQPGAGPAAILLDQEQRVIQIGKRIAPAVVSVATFNAAGERSGLGSGVIISRNGEILTNNHVVSGARRIQVTLADGREMAARNLGGDPGVDLAILKVEATNLPVAPLGDSDDLQVGQIAIAIGSPFGFDRTVSVGVVSALGRAIPGGGMSLSDLIQTDAQIYPGNSGGPLVNSAGNVIGINTAVVGGRTGGLGFAIPINTARNVVQDVNRFGRVIVPWIGISFGEITDQIAQVFDLPVTEGVIVASVERNGPAARAGIQRGDIITNAGGVRITSGGDLQRVIRERGVGSTLQLRMMRGRTERNATVTIGEMPTGR